MRYDDEYKSRHTTWRNSINKDDAKQLLGCLTDKSAGTLERSWSAYALRELIGNAVTGPFLAISIDREETTYLRCETLTMLGRLRVAEIVEPIASVLHDATAQPELRRAAADAFGSIGNLEAVKELLFALESENSGTRSFAAFALGAAGDVRAAGPLISILTKRQETEEARAYAARSLGRLSDGHAIEPLAHVLASVDPLSQLGVHTAVALNTLDASLAVDALILILHDSTDKWYRLSAIEALAKSRNEKALEPLIKALANDTFGWVCSIAANALIELEDERAVEPCIQILRSKNSFAKRVLGTLGEPAMLALTELRTDLDSEVRRRAYEALSYHGSSAFDTILYGLQDQDERIRLEVISFLCRIDEGRATTPIISMLGDKSPKVRRRAVEMLGEIANDQCIDALNVLAKKIADGEITGKGFCRLVKDVLAGAIWHRRRKEKPGLIRINGVEYELADGERIWVGDFEYVMKYEQDGGHLTEVQST